MKKKTLLALFLLIPSLAFAGNVHFIFDSLALHPEVVGGMLPTYLKVGVGYTGVSLLENNTTDLQLKIGGGYTQRQLFQDKVTGIPLANTTTYDKLNVINGEATANFVQGFLDNDMLQFNLGVTGSYEYRHQAITSTVYPDASKNNCLYTLFDTGLDFNMMDDKMFTQDGFRAKLHFYYAPKLLNQAFSPSDFYSANLDLQYAMTLFKLQAESGRNLFSVVLVDRFMANYTDGSMIPTYFQKKISLGNNVRGFVPFSYGTKLSFVNNLDIRLSTFEMPEVPLVTLMPRINLFFDAGYAMLDYYNSSYSVSGGELLMSSGVQATLSVSDKVDIGYQLAYLLSGENYMKPNSKFVTKVVFFLFF